MKKKNCKKLTYWLDEEWHDYKISKGNSGISTCSCGNTGMSVSFVCVYSNRTFDTWADVEALKDRLLYHNEFFAFIEYNFNTGYCFPDEIAHCILDPKMFCRMVLDYIKKGKK